MLERNCLLKHTYREYKYWHVSLRVKQLGSEEGCSPPSIVEVQNAFSYASTHTSSLHDAYLSTGNFYLFFFFTVYGLTLILLTWKIW